MHKKYTQYNCFLECMARVTQKTIMEKYNRELYFKMAITINRILPILLSCTV